MTEFVEAKDVDGQLYVSATGLIDALERARESGREIERAKWMCMLTPHERRMVRVRERCAEAGVAVEEVMSPTQRRRMQACWVRQDLYLEFSEEGMTSSDIGRFFNRDHTTVIHGIKVAKERRDARGSGKEVQQADSAVCAADTDD